MSSATVNIDTSYDERVVRRILARFPLEKIFSHIDWKKLSREEAEATAYPTVAKRFIEIKRYKAAAEFLSKSYILYPQHKVEELIKKINAKIPRSNINNSIKILLVVHNFRLTGMQLLKIIHTQ